MGMGIGMGVGMGVGMGRGCGGDGDGVEVWGVWGGDGDGVGIRVGMGWDGYWDLDEGAIVLAKTRAILSARTPEQASTHRIPASRFFVSLISRMPAAT